MKAKKHGVLILLIAIAFVISACGGAAQPAAQQASEPTEEPAATEMVTLTMNSSNLASFAPIFIAEAEGYFAEQGVHVEYITFNRTGDAIPLLISGDLDIYAGSVNSGLLNAVGQDPYVKVVADRGHISQDDQCAYHGVLVRKDLYESGQVTGPADLAGLTISSSNSGASGYLLGTYLAEAGLTFDDINLTNVPATSYPDAFETGALDGAVTPELNLSRVLSAGNAVLLAQAQDVYGSGQISMLAFGRTVLENNREAGVRFLAAYLKGIHQYNEGKTDRNLEILAEATGEDTDLLKESCWPSIREDGAIDFAGVDGFQQWSVEQGQLDAAVTEEQFWDPSLLQDAQALLNQ